MARERSHRPARGCRRPRHPQSASAGNSGCVRLGSRFAHRAELFLIVVYDRNGKWSSPRGGLSEQPLPLASSANAFHVLLVFSRMSTIVGWLRLGWFPSPPTPKVLPPRIAM